MSTPEERARRLIEAWIQSYPNTSYLATLIAAAIRDAVAEERARCVAVVEGAEFDEGGRASSLDATKAAIVAAIRREAT